MNGAQTRPDFDAQLRLEHRPGIRSKWTLGTLLTLDIALLLLVLSLANITAEEPAKRALGQSLAIITEIDAYLDVEYPALRDRAAATTQDVGLVDFPVELLFASDEVLASDQQAFRTELLERAAERVHASGASILREDHADEASFFSAENALRRGMDMLRPAPHRIFVGMTAALAIVALVLALGLAVATRGFGRMLALGLSVLAGAAPFLAGAIAVRFALRVAADGADDYMARQFLELAQELAWPAIRNAMIFSIGAGVSAVAASVLARAEDTGLLA